MALPHDVILVQHVTKEVAIVELVNKGAVQVLRQRLKPVLVIAPERDVEGDNVLYFTVVHSTIAYGSAGHSEAMQEGCFALLVRTQKKAPSTPLKIA